METKTLDGLIVLDKPSGLSSFMAVKLVQRAVGAKKAGHMGTLDPLASGVLVVGVGKGTKLFEKLLHGKKTYYAEYQFGVETDTLDFEGQIVSRDESALVTKQMLQQILPKFVGKMAQMPPKFSAKKVGGKRACDLVRAGKDVVLEPKEVEVFSLVFEKQIDQNLFGVTIECSSGFYVRALGRDIAKALGTVATTKTIRRTMACGFSLASAQTLEQIKTGNYRLYELEE